MLMVLFNGVCDCCGKKINYEFWIEIFVWFGL